MPSYLLSFYKANTRLRIDWPFAEYGHMVQETPCWMANDAEGQEIQRDYIIQKAKIISFQVPTASFLCHPKRCFLYHVAIFCKGPTEFPKKWFCFVISGYILDIETVSCPLLHGMDMDWNLEKLGKRFQVKYYVFKNHQKNYCLVLSDEICSISSDIVMTSAQKWRKTAISSWHSLCKFQCQHTRRHWLLLSVYLWLDCNSTNPWNATCEAI